MKRAVLTIGGVRCWAAVGVLALIVAITALALPAPSAADQVGICPDGFVPLPDASVANGAQKDKNANGIICVKFKDGKIVGGPDDDTILL